MTKFTIDLNKAIPAAWDMLWAQNLKQRKEDLAYEKKVGKKPFNWSRTYYLTASDIENQVREFAAATRDGKSWDKAHIAFGRPMNWPPIRISGDLKGTVRNWLLRGNGGKIVCHNFGRGHISGARFRPFGEPLATAETETMVKHEKRRKGLAPPKPIHFYDKGLLCQKKRTNGRHSFYSSRSRARSTGDRSEVTCKACLNLLPPLDMGGPGSISHMPDDNTHNCSSGIF
jgi:hypothetical protein